jgi:hypothetical protein
MALTGIEAVIKRPDCSLCAVAGPNFAQQALEMELNSHFSYPNPFGDHLISVAIDEMAQDINLARRQGTNKAAFNQLITEHHGNER